MEKSETKQVFWRWFSKQKIQSILQKKQVTSVILPQDIVEISSEVTHDSGKTFDSQETISDNEMYSDFYVTQTPDNNAFEKRINFMFILKKER